MTNQCLVFITIHFSLFTSVCADRGVLASTFVCADENETEKTEIIIYHYFLLNILLTLIFKNYGQKRTEILCSSRL